MPMPYSHLSLAYGYLNKIMTCDHNNFYIGAIMPDIRYFTRRPRNEYHFPIAKLNELTSSMNVPRSFVLGYGVHLLIDELWGTDELRDEYKTHFSSLVRNRLNVKILEAALEIFCLAYRPVSIQFAIQENELTKALGISTSGALTEAVQSFQRYIDQRHLQVGLQIAESSGMYTPERLTQMRYLSNLLEKRLTRALVHLLIVPPSRYIYERLVNGVLARVNEIHLPR